MEHENYTPEERDLDVAAARKLLARHGMVARIIGPDDVRARLVKLNKDPASYHCVNSRLTVQHIIEGDDWPSLEEETVEDDAKLWAMIDGTAHDHPEWFTNG